MLIPTVAVLVFKSNQILLVMHGPASKHITNVMGLPSGRVESGETEIQVAIRELKEETGLITTETDLIEFPNNYYIATIPRKNGSIEKFGWRVYLCKNYSGELQSADENETIPVWIKIDGLESLDLLPNVSNAVKACLKYQKDLNDTNS
jgi:ADP-ribose pyrophosphatase YjhB (NUDIX family)